MTLQSCQVDKSEKRSSSENQLNVGTTEQNLKETRETNVIVDFEDQLSRFRKSAFERIRKKSSKSITRYQTDTSKVVIYSNSKKFLYLRFSQHSWRHTLELYQLENTEPELLWKELWEDHSFLGDTIRDVNGDDQLDILTNYYPNSGCCRRNSFWVRPYDLDSKIYQEKIRLINPTFYPEDKIVRGVFYGHPGEVPLYKMKWNKNKLDTVEYIYPLKKDSRRYLLTNERKELVGEETMKKYRLIDEIPVEYRDVTDLDWFINY